MTLQSVDQAVDVEANTREAEAQVLLAAGAFGTSLRENPVFVRLREADAALGADEAAQEAIEAFNRRQSELGLEIRLGRSMPPSGRSSNGSRRRCSRSPPSPRTLPRKTRSRRSAARPPGF